MRGSVARHIRALAKADVFGFDAEKHLTKRQIYKLIKKYWKKTR